MSTVLSLLSFNDSRRSRTSITPTGSSPFIGSSMMSNCGLPSRAVPISRRRFMPREYCFTDASAAFSRPTAASTRLTSLFGSPHSIQREVKFSRPVKFKNAPQPSGTNPMFLRALARPVLPDSPKKLIEPFVALSKPRRISINVLFPAPFSPTRAHTSPSSISNETSDNAQFLP